MGWGENGLGCNGVQVLLLGSIVIGVVALSVVLLLLLLATLVLYSIRSLLIVVVVAALGSVAAVIVVIRHATVELSLNKEEDLLDELDGVGSLKEVGVELVGGELLSLVVEVSSVLGLGLLLSADLGELVVGDVELSTVDLCTVEACTGVRSAVGLLEADEGAGGGLTVVSGQDLDALDFSEALEVRAQIILSELGGEVLDEKVALLL